MNYIILVIKEDIPDNCPSCERFWDYELGNCRADKKFRIPEIGDLFNPNPRPDWCPLHQISIKEEL